MRKRFILSFCTRLMRFHTAADGDIHAVGDDLLGRRGDRHHARGALTVQRHARHGDRQPGADRGLTGDIAAGRALLERGTDDHVLDLGPFKPGAFDRVA